MLEEGEEEVINYDRRKGQKKRRKMRSRGKGQKKRCKMMSRGKGQMRRWKIARICCLLKRITHTASI